MRIVSRLFLCMMLITLFHLNLALANQNSGISDTDKIYVSPEDIVIMQNSFHVSINGSNVLVYQLLADTNGIFVIPSRTMTVQSWCCPRCNTWTCGFSCHVCGYPGEDER